MARWYRLALTLLLSLVLATGARTAWAMPEIGPTPGTGTSNGPVSEIPRDAPNAIAHEPIPPVPSSYVTKELGWLTLQYPPYAAERVESLISDADAVKAELAEALAQPVLARVTVRIAPTVSDMARLAPSDAPPPAYAEGVAYNGLHLIVLSMMAPHGPDAVDLDGVFRHELAHVALEDAIGGKHVPLWFNEGLAMWLSHEHQGARMLQLSSATLSDKLIPLSDLDRSMPRDNFDVGIAYAESADFMRFLMRSSDRLRFAAMIGRVREGQVFDRAVAEAYGSELRRLEMEWRSDLERRFSVIPILTGGGLVWVLVIVMLVAAYVRRRRRTKAILARWAQDEAIEDARVARIAQERAEEALPTVAIAVQKVSLKIEQDGGWHTLH